MHRVNPDIQSPKKKAREKELKAKRDEAKDARKSLEKKLKAQRASLYRKYRDKWPEEEQQEEYRLTREEYRLAKEAETMSRFEYDYLKDGAVGNGQSATMATHLVFYLPSRWP